MKNKFIDKKFIDILENQKWNRKKYRHSIVILMFLLVFVFGITGCQRNNEDSSFEEENKTKVVLTTGFGADEVFRIGNSVCDKKEAMVYLTNMQNQYEKVYGSSFWEKKIGDMTVEEKIKNVVLARIAQIKTMNLLAKEQNITLTETETDKALEAGKAYFASLTDTEKEMLDVSEKDIIAYYEEYALANKIYNIIIEDTNPEISDDEARTVTVSQIVIKTVTTNKDGQVEPVTDSSKKAAYEKMQTIRAFLSQGDDFDTLASRYNEAGQITVSFGKGEMEQIYENRAFELGTDEISSIFETSYGYVMLKCISTFDQEQTQQNKEKILNQRKEEAFSQIYDDFTVRQIRNLNEEKWNELHFIHDEQVTTSSFFENYDAIFVEE